MLKIVSRRKIYYGVSLLLVVASIIALSIWGLKTGIDFTGGSLLEVSFKNLDRPSNQEITNALSGLDLGNITVQPSGADGMILRFQDISEAIHQEILGKLQEKFAPDQEAGPADQAGTDIQVPGEGGVVLKGVTAETVGGAKVQEERFDSVGPTIGVELKTKSFYAFIIVVIAIIIYIAWAFRKVGRPVASWKYGVIAIVALIHDVTITCGVFAVLGHFFNIEVDTPFVAAVLTILGYSVNDTIVVFDRIRENLRRYQGDFEETINLSVNETIARSVNTSLTVLLTLAAIYFFGGSTIKYFSLALIVGIFFGTYSSIFIASPLLVTWQNLSRKLGK